jgi:hypothetical protein
MVDRVTLYKVLRAQNKIERWVYRQVILVVENTPAAFPIFGVANGSKHIVRFAKKVIANDAGFKRPPIVRVFKVDIIRGRRFDDLRFLIKNKPGVTDGTRKLFGEPVIISTALRQSRLQQVVTQHF